MRIPSAPKGSFKFTGGTQAQENGGTGEAESTGEAETASKRRRRSDDPDVAAAAVDADGAPADGPHPTKGHSVTGTKSDVPSEAAFWNALEDAKDVVGTNLHTTVAVKSICTMCWPAACSMCQCMFKHCPAVARTFSCWGPYVCLSQQSVHDMGTVQRQSGVQIPDDDALLGNGTSAPDAEIALDDTEPTEEQVEKRKEAEESFKVGCIVQRMGIPVCLLTSTHVMPAAPGWP